MPVLLFISIFTLLDFVVLFSVGSHIGLLTTLALVVLTGFVGLHLIRREGISTLARARARMQSGEIPSSEIFTGAALIFGGALLMAPGFLSDALGLACLLPNARQLMVKALTWFGLKTTLHQSGPRPQEPPHTGWNDQRGGQRDSTTIEGEFISREDEGRR
ncbi:FxsA family protein [Vreelandella sp. EE7]